MIQTQRAGAPKHPLLRYHGAKWKLAHWIIGLMPSDHRCYVEPFGGSAAVLLQKPPIPAEIYNDLEGAVVNVFRVLQDAEKAERLRHRMELTPYARAEFNRSYEPPVDDVDWAAKTIVLGYMGQGSDSITRAYRTGFRSRLSDTRATQAATWRKWPLEIPAFIERLRNVVIEDRDARSIITRYDDTFTLFFCDPPYVQSTRTNVANNPARGYNHDMKDEDHRELAELLRGCKGMVMLSGYPSELYNELYADWHFEETSTMADGGNRRVERLWFNPRAWEMSSRQRRLHLEAV